MNDAQENMGISACCVVVAKSSLFFVHEDLSWIKTACFLYVKKECVQ